jgi:N-acetylmuramoyl-L-alanine amidase
MASVEETKIELLRGAVQDNIDVLQGVRSKPKALRKRRVRPWLWRALLVTSIAYLTVPSLVVSRGRLPARDDAQSAAWVNPLASVDPSPESPTPLAEPHPLSRAVLPLSIKRIVIDPGHGGAQPGAISTSGVSEKEIALDVALRLRRLMAAAPFEILLTRQTDQTIPLDKRVDFANANKADLFVSIHVNWMEPHDIRALETYYVGPTDDPATVKLASLENRDSGYSLSDYKQILEKIYIDARRDESRTLAKTIQTELYQTLRRFNPVLENRGVKTAPFVVLVGTQMPAILVEISCLSNEDEVQLLTNEEYRENIAQALLKGLRAYAHNLNASGRKGN